MPLIVIEAEHQNWQLGTELDHLVGVELKGPTPMRRRKIQPFRSRNFRQSGPAVRMRRMKASDNQHEPSKDR
jgi:hypothetical protein